MNKYYIPTTTLNFNNILSSESISPKSFYRDRLFGYGRWYSIPENPFENSIVLYDELRSFLRPKSEVEDHPLLIEVALDESVEATLAKMGDHLFLSDHTIYIDPFSSKLLFFSEEDKNIALSLSDSSIETKFVCLYKKKIEVITPPAASYQIVEFSSEMQELNTLEIEKDKRINRMKGLLYGYYIGALLSTTKEDIIKLNTAREIRDILSAILASIDLKATMQQRERLRFLYFSIAVPFFTKLRMIISKKGIFDKDLFDDIVSLVKDEYGYIHGEINVDEIISKLLSSSTKQDEKNPVIEDIYFLIKQTEKDIEIKSKPVDVEDNQIVIVDGALANVTILSETDKILYTAWINDVLSKDEYSGKISTFKERLSDDVTRKARDMYDGEWKGSCPQVTLNALRRHVRGEKFTHKWSNDIFSSISALIISGEDWQKMYLFMQSKEMTDYRIVFSMYGTINGFANLPRDFTDVLFHRDSRYIAKVYKEFYRQLFCRNIVDTTKAEKSTEKSIELTKHQEVPHFENQLTITNTSNESKFPSEPDEGFDKLMEDIISKCRGAKNDKALYKKLYEKHGGLTKDFVDAVTNEISFNKNKGVQKGIISLLNKLIKPANTKKSLKKDSEQTPSLFTSSSTGKFLDDYDFLINNEEFSTLMTSKKSWKKDLKWFIDAHDPSHQGYVYYKGKPTDNASIVKQFINLKKSKYNNTKFFLSKLYKLDD